MWRTTLELSLLHLFLSLVLYDGWPLDIAPLLIHTGMVAAGLAGPLFCSFWPTLPAPSRCNGYLLLPPANIIPLLLVSTSIFNFSRFPVLHFTLTEQIVFSLIQIIILINSDLSRIS